jgi:putative ABC transport system permease protein
MTGAIISTIEVVSIMVIVIILAVVANTMAMTTRERIGEYAVLKTLGFSASHIAGLIFGESLVITTLGSLLGMTLTTQRGCLHRNWEPISRFSMWKKKPSSSA